MTENGGGRVQLENSVRRISTYDLTSISERSLCLHHKKWFEAGKMEAGKLNTRRVDKQYVRYTHTHKGILFNLKKV